MIKQLKDNLASIAALVGALVAIGGGFVKYGEITTRLNQIEANQGVDFAPIIKQIDETKSSVNGVAKMLKKIKSLFQKLTQKLKSIVKK